MTTPSAHDQAREIATGLYPHQVEGVAFLLGRQRAILADDMGLGKTRQSVIAMTVARPEGPYLVVCPASVKHNWAREIVMARPDAKAVVIGPGPPPGPDFDGWIIINFDLLKKHVDDLLARPLGASYSTRRTIRRTTVPSGPGMPHESSTGTRRQSFTS